MIAVTEFLVNEHRLTCKAKSQVDEVLDVVGDRRGRVVPRLATCRWWRYWLAWMSS